MFPLILDSSSFSFPCLHHASVFPSHALLFLFFNTFLFIVAVQLFLLIIAYLIYLSFLAAFPSFAFTAHLSLSLFPTLSFFLHLTFPFPVLLSSRSPVLIRIKHFYFLLYSSPSSSLPFYTNPLLVPFRPLLPSPSFPLPSVLLFPHRAALNRLSFTFPSLSPLASLVRYSRGHTEYLGAQVMSEPLSRQYGRHGVKISVPFGMTIT